MRYDESAGGGEGGGDGCQRRARHRRRPPTEIPHIKLGSIYRTGEGNLPTDTERVARLGEGGISTSAIIPDVYVLIEGIGLAIDDDREIFPAEGGVLGSGGVADSGGRRTARTEEPHDIAGGINPGFHGTVGAAAGLDEDFRFVGALEGGKGRCNATRVLVEVLGEAGNA